MIFGKGVLGVFVSFSVEYLKILELKLFFFMSKMTQEVFGPKTCSLSDFVHKTIKTNLPMG